MKKYTAIKTFHDFPCAHRAWKHKGVCRFLHGYCRAFTFHFESDSLDENGFVIDLSSLRGLESWLRSKFDHTVLIATADPHLPDFQHLSEAGVLTLTILPLVSSEGIASYIIEHSPVLINDLLRRTDTRVYVEEGNRQMFEQVGNRMVKLAGVTVRENEKIMASATP